MTFGRIELKLMLLATLILVGSSNSGAQPIPTHTFVASLESEDLADGIRPHETVTVPVVLEAACRFGSIRTSEDPPSVEFSHKGPSWLQVDFEKNPTSLALTNEQCFHGEGTTLKTNASLTLVGLVPSWETDTLTLIARVDGGGYTDTSIWVRVRDIFEMNPRWEVERHELDPSGVQTVPYRVDYVANKEGSFIIELVRRPGSGRMVTGDLYDRPRVPVGAGTIHGNYTFYAEPLQRNADEYPPGVEQTLDFRFKFDVSGKHHSDVPLTVIFNGTPPFIGEAPTLLAPGLLAILLLALAPRLLLTPKRR